MCSASFCDDISLSGAQFNLIFNFNEMSSSEKQITVLSFTSIFAHTKKIVCLLRLWLVNYVIFSPCLEHLQYILLIKQWAVQRENENICHAAYSVSFDVNNKRWAEILKMPYQIGVSLKWSKYLNFIAGLE